MFIRSSDRLSTYRECEITWVLCSDRVFLSGGAKRDFGSSVLKAAEEHGNEGEAQTWSLSSTTRPRRWLTTVGFTQEHTNSRSSRTQHR
jgi:hypothetical protein